MELVQNAEKPSRLQSTELARSSDAQLTATMPVPNVLAHSAWKQEYAPLDFADNIHLQDAQNANKPTSYQTDYVQPKTTAASSTTEEYVFNA